MRLKNMTSLNLLSNFFVLHVLGNGALQDPEESGISHYIWGGTRHPGYLVGL